jgi:hypothetical protein
VPLRTDALPPRVRARRVARRSSIASRASARDAPARRTRTALLTATASRDSAPRFLAPAPIHRVPTCNPDATATLGKDIEMQARSLQSYFLWTTLFGGGVLLACGTTSGAPSNPGGACPQGTMLCPTCGDGAGYCALACSEVECPTIPDGASGDEGSAIGASDGGGPCPGVASTLCSDCSGMAFCVSGGCPAQTCPLREAGAAPADAGSCDACGPGQLCVHPSCAGGNAPPCSALNDAGGCAAGWTYSPLCQFYGGTSMTGPGCRPPPCVPPPAFCVDPPAACGSTAKCSCLPTNVCEVSLPGNVITGGQCQGVNGLVVSCGSA